MDNFLNNEQVKVNPGFVLTSKVISKGALEKPAVRANVVSGYVSTTNQTQVASKEQNNAIRNFAMANFSLKSSSALNRLNAAMKQERMNRENQDKIEEI